MGYVEQDMDYFCNNRGHIFFISSHPHKVASCYSELQPVNHVKTPILTPKSVRSAVLKPDRTHGKPGRAKRFD